MFYNPDTCEAYLCPPRTASRSVSRLLKAHGWRNWLGRHDNLTVVHPATRRKQPPADMPSSWSRVYCTIRNPFDVIVSWWAFIDEEPSSFDSWLRGWFLGGKPTGALRALPPRVFGDYCEQWTDVLRYEQLEADMCEVFDWCEPGMLEWVGRGDTRRWECTNPPEGVPSSKYPYEWERRSFQTYYTPEARALVEAAYSDELRELGYSFEE